MAFQMATWIKFENSNKQKKHECGKLLVKVSKFLEITNKVQIKLNGNQKTFIRERMREILEKEQNKDRTISELLESLEEIGIVIH